MKPTRQHIADKALGLFNGKGYVNVRLQHIADAAFVSIGHLAYHFKNKETLLDYLYQHMKAEKERLLNEHKVLPLFEDVGKMLEQLFYHQAKYRFFYTDTLEITRAVPALAEQHRPHIAWQHLQLSLMLRFNVSRGAMEIPDAETDHFARLLQRFLDNWWYNALAENRTDISAAAFSADAWQLLSTRFTHTGQVEYRQYRNSEISGI